jgi:3-oxoacyl-[acyl-carrier protein] reductase
VSTGETQRDRVVLVAGAGGNLGRAVTSAFADVGAHVAVNVRSDRERADSIAEAAQRSGVRAAAIVGDVATPAGAAAVVAEAGSALGPVDVLVHCVGYRVHGPILETTPEDWQRSLETNCSSFLRLAQEVVPPMADRGWGRLIAITGSAATRPSRGYGAVGVSKAALATLVSSIALEVGGAGITVNAVSPAVTEAGKTEAMPAERMQALLAIPRPARFAEIASACLYLASDDAAYVTGQTLHVDGGLHI